MSSAMSSSSHSNTLANLLALKPPPGVTPNFEDPFNQGPILIIVGSILNALMILFVLARAYTKLFIIRKASWDDLTCALAMFGAVAYFVCCIFAVKAKVGIHVWNVRIFDLASNAFLVPSYLTDVLAPVTLLCAKLSFFLLYLQIFGPNKALRFCIYGGLAITTGFYISITIAQFIFITPHLGETFLAQFESSLGAKSIQLSVPLSVVGIVIDFYILVLPIVGVSQLQLATRRKLGVVVVFMTGSIACLSSVLSLYFRVLLNQSADLTWHLFPVITLALVEICVGVICSCMPHLTSFFRHHRTSLKKVQSKVITRSPFGVAKRSHSRAPNDAYLESQLLGSARGQGKFLDSMSSTQRQWIYHTNTGQDQGEGIATLRESLEPKVDSDNRV